MKMVEFDSRGVKRSKNMEQRQMASENKAQFLVRDSLQGTVKVLVCCGCLIPDCSRIRLSLT